MTDGDPPIPRKISIGGEASFGDGTIYAASEVTVVAAVVGPAGAITLRCWCLVSEKNGAEFIERGLGPLV